MERQSVCAHDQVLNLVLVQQSEQFFEVWLKVHSVGGEGIPLR